VDVAVVRSRFFAPADPPPADSPFGVLAILDRTDDFTFDEHVVIRRTGKRPFASASTTTRAGSELHQPTLFGRAVTNEGAR